MRIALLMLTAVLMLPLLAQAEVATHKENTVNVQAPTKAQSDAVKEQGRYLATITLASGKVIEVVLEGAEMPYTVANFKQLADAKFYDGLNFHRVEPNFVIQGGDPNGDGSGGPGYMINLEINPFLKHKKGAISMARTNKPNTAGCQFFITLADTPFLDAGYAVFGWVKSGMEHVQQVKVGDKMASVTVEPYAGTEPCPLITK
jgi:peptidyl-prolyl cis-trans isomerase B (cyclophilin B)